MWFRALQEPLELARWVWAGLSLPGKGWTEMGWQAGDNLAGLSARALLPMQKETTIEIAILDASALPDGLRERNSCTVDSRFSAF